MVYSTTWDETTPAGSEARSLGDDRIRELKVQLRERLIEWLGVASMEATDKAVFPSGTKLGGFYQDTAPTGWAIADTLDDKLVYITKGSAAGGQIGGDVHVGGSWTISGLAHTHTGPSHTHSLASGTDFLIIGGGNRSRETEASGTEVTGSGGASDGTWRPSAYCCIICSKN